MSQQVFGYAKSQLQLPLELEWLGHLEINEEMAEWKERPTRLSLCLSLKHTHAQIAAGHHPWVHTFSIQITRECTWSLFTLSSTVTKYFHSLKIHKQTRTNSNASLLIYSLDKQPAGTSVEVGWLEDGWVQTTRLKGTICTINLQFYLLHTAGRGSLASWHHESQWRVHLCRSLNLG